MLREMTMVEKFDSMDQMDRQFEICMDANEEMVRGLVKRSTIATNDKAILDIANMLADEIPAIAKVECRTAGSEPGVMSRTLVVEAGPSMKCINFRALHLRMQQQDRLWDYVLRGVEMQEM